MKQFPLDELPKRSEWAAYLLAPNCDPPDEPTAYTGTESYEKIYSQLLERYREEPMPAAEAVEKIRSKRASELHLVSTEQTLYLVETDELVRKEYEMVQTALDPVLSGGETVLDLGCGWGWTLEAIASSFPTVQVRGGEYASSGVKFARRVFADDSNQIAVKQFDFFGDWELIDDADGECVVFTKGALVTLPETETVVDRLAALADEGPVTAGVHLEQVGPHPKTVLGQLRQQYSRERGYDDSALERIRASPELNVIDVTYDVHGSNPLHPLTRIRWEAR